jgi:hypothetical protein
MLHRPLPFLLLAGLLGSCNSNPSDTKNKLPLVNATEQHSSSIDSARLQDTKDSLAVLATSSDTFRASNRQVFRMQQISKSQYDAASGSDQKRTFPTDSAAAVATEKAFLKAEAGRVWRAADTLFFRISGNHIVWLHDGPTYHDAEDSYEGYRYLENLTAIQQWLVEVGQWEGRHYLLVDQKTGKKTKLISYPVISPDHTRFACANSDPTGYSLDGLQLWQKPAGKSPRLMWQRLSNVMQNGVTALSPCWDGNNTLFIYEDFTIAGRYMRIAL